MAATDNSTDAQDDNQEVAEDMHLVAYGAESGRLVVNPKKVDDALTNWKEIMRDAKTGAISKQPSPSSCMTTL